VAAAVLVAAGIVGGYVVWLRASAGVWSFAPKGGYAMAAVARRQALEGAGIRLSEGRLYERIRFELDGTGGAFILPSDPREIPDSDAARLKAPGLYLLRHGARNLLESYRIFSRSEVLFPPALLLLTGIGLAVVAAGGRLPVLAILLLASGTSFVFVFSHVLSRFTLPAVGLLVPLAGAGVAALFRPLARFLPRGRPILVRTLPAALSASLALLCLVPSMQAVRGPGAPPDPVLAAAGRGLIRPGGPPPVVMSINEVPAYYAGAAYEPVPYAETEAVLRFAERRGVDYIVLERGQTGALRPDLVSILDARSWAPGGGHAEWEAVWSEPGEPPYRAAAFGRVEARSPWVPASGW
jgi:hypothetical protein